MKNNKSQVTSTDLFFTLQFWIKNGKTRIKCASDDCAVRIHENDVRKVLDPENDELNALISRAERHYLLYKHDKDVIFYALGGDRFAKQCPLCRVNFLKNFNVLYYSMFWDF